MQKYIQQLEGFVKSNNEAVEAVVQYLAEKDKIECNFFSFSSFLSLLCINYFNINMHKIFCTKNAKKENLQHPVMDAVFLCRNPQKNTEKIKIRYIG